MFGSFRPRTLLPPGAGALALLLGGCVYPAYPGYGYYGNGYYGGGRPYYGGGVVAYSGGWYDRWRWHDRW